MRKWLVVVMTASAFGPYVLIGPFSLRLDQLMVYLPALVLLPLLYRNLRLTLPAVVTLSAWVLYLAVALLSFASPVPNPTNYATESALANFDNLAMPLAMFLLVSCLAIGQVGEITEVLARVVAAGAVLNALVALAHFLAPKTLLPILVENFWGAGQTGERALELGRYTGLIGQPSVTGVIYSLGLVCSVYALRDRPVWMAAAIAMITLGGVLAVTKAFLLIGLPIGALMIIRSTKRRIGQRAAAGLAVVGLYVTLTSSGLLSTWSGFTKLQKLLPGQEVDFSVYAGNRYGTATRPLTEAVLSTQPWLGYGLRGLATATDTALVEALVLAGLIGVVCVLVAVAVPLVATWRSHAAIPRPRRLLYQAVTAVLFFSTLGSVALTGNRLAVLVWALLAVILAPADPDERPGEPDADEVGVARPWRRLAVTRRAPSRAAHGAASPARSGR